MIILIGHGYIGQYIAKEFDKQHIGIIWDNHNSFSKRVLDPKQKYVIINAAGYTGYPNVDACEENRLHCLNGNVAWPLMCESVAKNNQVIHISSGCVYTGKKRNGFGWTEKDEPNFKGSFYSLTKVLAQEVLGPCMNKSYILRIRMPFGIEDHPKNLLTKLKSYSKIINVQNSLSRATYVAKVAVYFAKNLPEPGIYNVCNPGEVTNYEITHLLGIKKEWFTTEEFEKVIKAPRSTCTLDVSKLLDIFPIPDVNYALRASIKGID